MARTTSPLFSNNRLTKIIIVLVFCIVSILYSLIRIMYQNYSVNQRIDTLEQEIARLQQNNLEQENKILYYATDAYIEKTLREKLNYTQEGEKIYATGRKDPEQERLLQEQRKFREQEDNKPNLIRWWEFFFGSKPQDMAHPTDNIGSRDTQ